MGEGAAFHENLAPSLSQPGPQIGPFASKQSNGLFFPLVRGSFLFLSLSPSLSFFLFVNEDKTFSFKGELEEFHFSEMKDRSDSQEKLEESAKPEVLGIIQMRV